MLTMPTPSPQSSSPGACSLRGSEWKPPLGIVFAPHSTRSPPSRILRIFGWVFSSWSRSCDGELDVAVVEPDDDADRDHVVAHRVDERAAELAVLRLPVRSGQPIVWTTSSSGFATFQTSFTPSSQTCGSLPREPEPVERDAGEVALRPLGEHGHLRDEVGAGLEVAAAPCPRGRGPCRRCARRRRGRARRAASAPRSRAGSSRRPPPRARRASGRAARARRSSCRGSASAAAAGSRSGAALREDVDGLAVHLAVRRAAPPCRKRSPNSRRSAARVDDRAREEMRAGLLALLERARPAPRRAARPSPGCSSSSWPSRIAQASPAGPRADDEDADLDPLVDRVGRLARRSRAR